MKLLLELLDDSHKLLSALDSPSELRPETREELEELLEGLREESKRLLDGSEQTDRGDSDGEGGIFLEHCGDWLLQRALEAISKGDYKEARKWLEQGREAFPEDPEFPTHLGLICWEQGMIEEAGEHYGRAMELSFPDGCHGEIDWSDEAHAGYLRAMEGKALCLYELDEYEEALPFFDALANTNVDSYSGCRYLAAESRHVLGDLEDAIDDYRRGPNEPATLYNLALAQCQRGDRGEAARTFIRAMVGNVHVSAILLGEEPTESSALPGYLGSRDYAEDFCEACQSLWDGADDALELLEICATHPSVQDYLTECRERGEDVLESQHTAGGQREWLDRLARPEDIDGIASSIVGQ